MMSKQILDIMSLSADNISFINIVTYVVNCQCPKKMVLAQTLNKIHATRRMEFHHKNIFLFDVNRLFVFVLILVFPWSKFFLNAEVHDL